MPPQMRIPRQQWGFRTAAATARATARVFTASTASTSSRVRTFGYRTLRNPTASIDSNTMPMPQIDGPIPPLSHSPSDAALPKFGSALLHRTPWTPPTAVRASGINIQLEDGRQVIDAVGGAAVSCLGMGNQKVMDAIKTQMENLTCQSIHVLVLFGCDTQQRDAPANRPRVIQVSKQNKPS